MTEPLAQGRVCLALIATAHRLVRYALKFADDGGGEREQLMEAERTLCILRDSLELR